MQLKLLSCIFQIFLTVGVTGMPNPETKPELAAEGEAKELLPRSCDFTDRCTAAPGSSGTYCGYCEQVQTYWVNADVYELYPNGACCNYGYRTSCDIPGYDASQCPI